jgi:hypothetical protein
MVGVCPPAIASKRPIATLVERHTRYLMLTKVAKKDTQTVVSALTTRNVDRVLLRSAQPLAAWLQ